MRRAALIYNPASGQFTSRRKALVKRLTAVLIESGIEADALETDAPGSARVLARMAARNGYDTVIACGGDGTVHEALQSLVGTGVALGVVPLGTANALAQDLNLGRDPVKALRRLLDAEPTEIPVGRIFYRTRSGFDDSSYFTVAAGIGADALLMASMDKELKRKLGYLLYLTEAFRIWATNPFPLFRTAFSVNGSGEKREEEVSQLLAIRIRSFGGVLRELAPGATLRSNELSVISFRTRNRFRYLTFLLAVIAGRHSFYGDVELVQTSRIECTPRSGSKAKIFVEADGEVLGSLPARMEIAEEKLTLLVPQQAKP